MTQKLIALVISNVADMERLNYFLENKMIQSIQFYDGGRYDPACYYVVINDKTPRETIEVQSDKGYISTQTGK